MNKALKATFGTIMMVGLIAPVYAHLENDFAVHSAISITGTYTDTSNNTLSMGDYIVPFDFSSDIISRRAIFIDTDPDFDYAVGYTYHIPCTHTRFFITYDHFYSDDDNTATGYVTNIEIAPIDPPGGFAAPLPTSAYGRVQQYAEELRIGFSHLLSFSPRYFLDVNAYFEWDKVRRILTERAKFIADPETIANFEAEDQISGWGPGVGATGFVKPFCNLHWGFFMGFKTTLIWAENEFTETLVRSPSFGGPGDYILNPEQSESLVTKLDITFGLEYGRILHTDVGRMLFEMDLGMRYMNMFNVFKNGNTAYNSLFDSSGLNYAANTGYAYDWGRIGPFLTFRLGGAHA